MNKKLLLVLFSGMVSLSSCYYDKEEELYPVADYSGDTTTYYYMKDIKPMMSNNCAYGACHVAGAQAPDLSSYTALKNNLARAEYRALTEKTMPKAGPMSALDRHKFARWISLGALNN